MEPLPTVSAPCAGGRAAGGGGEWATTAGFVAAVAVSAAVAGGLTWWIINRRGDDYDDDEDEDPEHVPPSLEEVWAEYPELMGEYGSLLRSLAPGTDPATQTQALGKLVSLHLQAPGIFRNKLRALGVWQACAQLFLSLSSNEGDEGKQLPYLCALLSFSFPGHDGELARLRLVMLHAATFVLNSHPSQNLGAQPSCARLLTSLIELPQGASLARDVSSTGVVAALGRAMVLEPLPPDQPATKMQAVALGALCTVFGHDRAEMQDNPAAVLVRELGLVERLMEIFERSQRGDDCDLNWQDPPLSLRALELCTLCLLGQCNPSQVARVCSETVAAFLIRTLRRHLNPSDNDALVVLYKAVHLGGRLHSKLQRLIMKQEYRVPARRFVDHFVKRPDEAAAADEERGSGLDVLVSLVISLRRSRFNLTAYGQDVLSWSVLMMLLSIAQENREARGELRANDVFMEAVAALAEPSVPAGQESAFSSECARELLSAFELP